MSRWSKIAWLLCGLSVLILVAVRFILGGWANFLYIPLAVFAVSFAFAVVFDWKFYLEFFTLRTTKHGMNMGVLIILVIALLAAMNMLSVRFNKSFDLTSEKLNSLSDQTSKVVKDLKEDLEILVFYRGQQDQEPKMQIKDLLTMYEDESSKVKVRFVDAYREHGVAQKYLKDIKGEPGLVLFAQYQGRKIRAQQPLQEEQVTTAIIKATRTDKKKIYFLQGHGEKDLVQAQSEDGGLSLLKQGLEDSSFQVETLNLMDKSEMPADAAIVAIIGPTSQILDREMDILRAFARRGGRFLIAADPGERNNIPQLVKTFGIEYANNYLVNEFNFLAQRDAGEALGVMFDRESDITKAFRSGNNFTAFPLASQVKRAPDAPTGLKIKELVKTNEASYAVTDITKPSKPTSGRQPFAIAISSEGSLPAMASTGSESEKDKENEKKAEPNAKGSENFAAVVFGDSEFLTNGWIIQGINRDLALNSVAYLAKEADLISVRPKKAEGTQLVMSPTARVVVVLLGLLLPLSLLTSSGVVWFRRRGA